MGEHYPDRQEPDQAPNELTGEEVEMSEEDLLEARREATRRHARALIASDSQLSVRNEIQVWPGYEDDFEKDTSYIMPNYTSL